MFNAFYEKNSGGSWTSWTQPLEGSEQLLRGTSVDAVQAKVELGQRIIEFGSTLDEQGWESFKRCHARPHYVRDIPDIKWPPSTRFAKTLDFIAPIADD